MLRRLNVASNTNSSQRALVARASMMALHTTRGVLSNNNNTNKPYSSEDQAELERERALREKFAQKIGGFTNFGASAFSSNTSSSTASSSSSGSGVSNNNSNAAAGSSPIFRIFFFMFTIYLFLLIAQLENPNSAISLFQGMRWWQVPMDTVAYLILMRTILPYRDQNRIKGEFEDAVRRDPNITMPIFFQQRYPAIFQGNRASQQEIVAAVAACLAFSRDISIATNLSKAVGMARDQKKAVDDIMAYLGREYPAVFAPTA